MPETPIERVSFANPFIVVLAPRRRLGGEGRAPDVQNLGGEKPRPGFQRKAWPSESRRAKPKFPIGRRRTRAFRSSLCRRNPSFHAEPLLRAPTCRVVKQYGKVVQTQQFFAFAQPRAHLRPCLETRHCLLMIAPSVLSSSVPIRPKQLFHSNWVLGRQPGLC